MLLLKGFHYNTDMIRLRDTEVKQEWLSTKKIPHILHLYPQQRGSEA